jgi:hypothetical protein
VLAAAAELSDNATMALWQVFEFSLKQLTSRKVDQLKESLTQVSSPNSGRIERQISSLISARAIAQFLSSS